MVAAIPRTAWQDPANPVTGPARKKRFTRGVVHWEGAVGRNYTPADIAKHLRDMQASYKRIRGYSLGYGFAVVSDVTHKDDGTRWQIRGTDINMASNPGAKWNKEGRVPSGNVNDWTGSILIIGPANKPVSPKAAASIRTIFAEWHAEAKTPPLRPMPHAETDYTDCCGALYRANLTAGMFDPQLAPPPPPPPAQGVPDMFFPINPFRNADTRAFGGAGIDPGEHRFGLHPAVIPANAVAVALNVTVLPAGVAGFCTIWPDNHPRPNASVLNYEASGAHNGAIAVGVANNHFRLFLDQRAHVIIDVSGYWTP